MNEKELIAFLKKNMRIELDERYWFEWDETPRLTVKIIIGDQEICKETIQRRK